MAQNVLLHLIIMVEFMIQHDDDDPRCHVTDPVRLHEDVDEICDWPGRSQGTLATLINVDNKLTTVLGVLGNVIGNSITFFLLF